MIKITVTRIGQEPLVREFADVHHAADWFIQDSYFMENYVLKAVWERTPPTGVHAIPIPVGGNHT